MAEKTRLIPAIAAKRSRSLRSALVLNITFCLLSLYLIKHAYESTRLPKDPHQRALRLMRDHPLIDGHVRITLLVLMQALNSADRLTSQSISVTRELHASLLYGLWAQILSRYGDQPYEVDFRKENSTSDVSIPALRKGHVGGFFWSRQCHVTAIDAVLILEQYLCSAPTQQE